MLLVRDKASLYIFHSLKIVSMVSVEYVFVAFREVWSPKLRMRSRLERDGLLMSDFLEARRHGRTNWKRDLVNVGVEI